MRKSILIGAAISLSPDRRVDLTDNQARLHRDFRPEFWHRTDGDVGLLWFRLKRLDQHTLSRLLPPSSTPIRVVILGDCS